ncbi:PREDICTED: taste receptor type 2 member 14-like [Chinchilla lanigera]|uniref:taste receptor type 2 member 14-like n=1 Tax=Chinchilla lanigera TaxID=34839 RepID=UPI00038EDB96|nr:PREDICTED: taste receptor type 2 member 14-like [Chinchilla lanigera]
MVDVLKSIFTIILSAESIIGIVGNVFIALVNCMDWIKRRKISLVDQILTSLAISRLGLLCSALTHTMLYTVHPDWLKTEKMLRMFIIAWVVTNHFSIWLATCLILFYFLKIANFSNSIFLYLKWKVKKVVLVALLISLVLLLFNIIAIDIQINVWMDRSKRNVSYTYSLKNFKQLPRLLLFYSSMFMLIPFIMSLIACVLLIFSLWKHWKKMRHNAKGSRDAGTAAHIKAMQTVITFLLLYTMYLFCLIMQISSFEFLEEENILFFEHAIGIAFPSGHSLALIPGNSKLRQAFLSVPWCLWCRAKG